MIDRSSSRPVTADEAHFLATTAIGCDRFDNPFAGAALMLLISLFEDFAEQVESIPLSDVLTFISAPKSDKTYGCLVDIIRANSWDRGYLIESGQFEKALPALSFPRTKHSASVGAVISLTYALRKSIDIRGDSTVSLRRYTV